MMRTRIGWIFIAWLAWSCGDEAESNDDGSGGGSAGSSGHATGGTGNSSSGGTGNSPGDTTDPACIGYEPLVLALTRDGQLVYDQGPRRFVATLTRSAEDSAIFETCPGADGGGGEGGAGSSGAASGGEGGASDCAVEALRLEVEARGLALPIAVGTIVDVNWDFDGGGGTAVRSMAVLRNQGDTTTAGFLLGVGNGLPLAASPVTYTSSEVDCDYVPPAASCGSRVAYAITFMATQNPSSSTRLTMGQTGRLELDPDSDTPWRAHNSQSMSSGNCDAVDPFRFYVVRAQ